MEGIGIELLGSFGNDNSIANAARVSFSSFGDWLDIPDGYSEERAEKLVKYLAEHKHLCVFRHNLITLKCKAPIFIVRQLGKHQAGLTWSEVSRRYVKSSPEFFEVKHRAAPEGSVKQGSSDAHVCIPDVEIGGDTFDIKDVVDSIGAWYDEAVNEYSLAPEVARAYLPQSMQTEWIWSGNLLAFAHVYNERSAGGAQKEAQAFAEKLDTIIAPLFPVAWKALTGR